MSATAPAIDPEQDRQERASRLARHKNILDLQLTQEYYKWARKMCEAPILVAVKCREQEGMLAGFKCRDEHRKIYECLGVYTKDEKRMAEFKAVRTQEIIDAGLGAAAPLED